MTATANTATHTIHLLVRPTGVMAENYGLRSLCGQPTGRPESWPDGHLFVRLQAGGAAPPVVNCPECLQRHQQLIRGG